MFVLKSDPKNRCIFFWRETENGSKMRPDPRDMLKLLKQEPVPWHGKVAGLEPSSCCVVIVGT